MPSIFSLSLRASRARPDSKYKDEIDVLVAWSWGAAQSGTTHVGSGGGAGKVSVQDLSITKYIDKSSPTLFSAFVAAASTSVRAS